MLFSNGDEHVETIPKLTMDELAKVAAKHTSSHKLTFEEMNDSEIPIEIESDDDLEDAFEIINGDSNETDDGHIFIKPLRIKVIDMAQPSVDENGEEEDRKSAQNNDEFGDDELDSKDDEEKQFVMQTDKNKPRQDKDGNYDIEFERSLKSKMCSMIFEFDNICKKDKDWKAGGFDKEKGIKSHYKIHNSLCELRAEMDFEHEQNIFDYFLFLECGYNDDDAVWGKQTTTELVKTFDNDHQLMYTHGHAGTLQKIFIYPRDVCYMRTRFALNGMHNGQLYDVISSMNYSVHDKHPYYVEVPNKYVRADLNYRGFALIEPKEDCVDVQTRKLVYISSFDFHGQIPRLIIEQNLKNKAMEVIQQFDATWNDKMKMLEERRTLQKDAKKLAMPKKDELFKQNMFKSWLDDIGLPQYYQVLVDNGFDHLSYLKNDVDVDHLQSIGIHKIGHCLKLIAEIKKLEIEE